MPIEHIYETVDTSHKERRISLTDMARTNRWRKQLEQYPIVEVTDHADPYAFIVSADGMNSLVEHMHELEAELEQREVADIIHKRDNPGKKWLEGKELADEAIKLLMSEDR